MSHRTSAGRVIQSALEAAEAQGFEVITKTRTAYVRNKDTGVADHVILAPGGNRGLPNAVAQLRRLGVCLDGSKKRVINLAVVPPITEEEVTVPQDDDEFEAALAMLREAHYSRRITPEVVDLTTPLAEAGKEVVRLNSEVARLTAEIELLRSEVTRHQQQAAEASAAIDLITEVAQVAATEPIRAVQLIMNSLR